MKEWDLSLTLEVMPPIQDKDGVIKYYSLKASSSDPKYALYVRRKDKFTWEAIEITEIRSTINNRKLVVVRFLSTGDMAFRYWLVEMEEYFYNFVFAMKWIHNKPLCDEHGSVVGYYKPLSSSEIRECLGIGDSSV